MNIIVSLNLNIFSDPDDEKSVYVMAVHSIK